ncbi:MAG TPA: hypothetical protein VFA22_00315 [Stellaceae bacterium]|nr:hypothetical protein [Stellaceae bacterium]
MEKVAFAATAALVALVAIPVVAAEKKEPPACAAIAFRPVPSGLGDGVQDAGIYKSRFGRIDLKANVKGGAAESYYVEINGKPLEAIPAGKLPKEADACAKVKRMSAPAKPLDPCSGDRLTVLITHHADKRYFLLYGHSGGAWHYCSAGTA